MKRVLKRVLKLKKKMSAPENMKNNNRQLNWLPKTLFTFPVLAKLIYLLIENELRNKTKKNKPLLFQYQLKSPSGRYGLKPAAASAILFHRVTISQNLPVSIKKVLKTKLKGLGKIPWTRVKLILKIIILSLYCYSAAGGMKVARSGFFENSPITGKEK